MLKKFLYLHIIEELNYKIANSFFILEINLIFYIYSNISYIIVIIL